MGYSFKLEKILEMINFHSKLVDDFVESSSKKQSNTLPAWDQIKALKSEERTMATELRAKLTKRIKKYVK